MLERCPQAHVIGIDRDVHALDRSRERLAPYGERVTFVHAVYDEIAEVLAELGHPPVDGVLFDLGVSSMQLDVRERGFAYAEDAPLDMRMDDTAGPTAADVLNEYPVEELARILRQYGEEQFARRIAEAVVRERETGAVHPVRRGSSSCSTTRSRPRPGAPAGTRPSAPSRRCASRSTTSCRCCAGRCPAAIDAIGVGGRVVVMSYHSLEDRITKQAFAERTRSDLPPDLPFVPEGHEPALRLVTRGAGEGVRRRRSSENPRAASVRLRAVERVRAEGSGMTQRTRARAADQGGEPR